MPNTNKTHSVRIPLTYSCIRNNIELYQNIQQRVKELYPDVTDEFAGKIAQQYIRGKLKDDPKGLLDAMTTVDSSDIKESGAAVLNSNDDDDENSQGNINITDKSLSGNNSKHTPTKPEITSGNVKAVESNTPKNNENINISTNCSDIPEKNRSKPHMSRTKDYSSAKKVRGTAGQILPGDMSYEDFRSLTNVEEVVKKDIMKKYPKDNEKYIDRIEKFIKKYYENSFFFESQWPGLIKFYDSSIRTLNDLNRVKSERLQAERILPEETAKDAPATISQQIDPSEMGSEINPSPDLFPSSGESKDENNRTSGICTGNTSGRIHAMEYENLSQGVQSNVAKTKEIVSDLNAPPEITNSEILGRSLPDLHENENEKESSYIDNMKGAQLSCDDCDCVIQIENRNLSLKDTNEPYNCEDLIETASFVSLSTECDLTTPFQYSMIESRRSVHETQKTSPVKIDENGSLDVDLISNNDCNLWNSFSQPLNDVTFCDVANIPSSDPNQTVNSQDADPLTLKSESLNLMNISSSSSSIETVIFNTAAKYARCFEKSKQSARHSAVQALPENDIFQENSHFAAISSQQIHSDSTANKNIYTSDCIPSSDSTNISMQSKNRKTIEMVTNEELFVLRKLSHILNERGDDICHSADLKSLSFNAASEASCAAEYNKKYVTVNSVGGNEQAHVSAIIKLEATNENIKDEEKNIFLDSTSDVEFIENEPTLPIVVGDTEEEMDTLVARMMDISESRQNSIMNASLTELCNKNAHLENELNSQTDILEPMNTNSHETHNVSDTLQLGLNTPKSSGAKSSKESIKTTSARESMKRPLKNLIDLNEHRAGKKKKTKNETNILKPKKKVPIKNKIIDGIVVPIIPQITHSFRPLELIALSKGMTSTIQVERSTNLGASHLQCSQSNNGTEYIIDDASQTEIIPPRHSRVSLSHALSGDDTYFREISIGEKNNENLSISSQHNSFDDNASYHEESRREENIILYQHIWDHSTTWITFLKINTTPYELSYDSYLPVLNPMGQVSVESQVLIRLNEIFYFKIIGNKINVHYKWNFANDSLLVAMLSALLSPSAENEYKGGSFVQLCAFGQILNQFRKYLKLNIRVEQRHKDFLSNSNINHFDKTVVSKVFILEVIKFIELCKSFYDSM